jgi:hypothetical protein
MQVSIIWLIFVFFVMFCLVGFDVYVEGIFYRFWIWVEVSSGCVVICCGFIFYGNFLYYGCS